MIEQAGKIISGGSHGEELAGVSRYLVEISKSAELPGITNKMAQFTKLLKGQQLPQLLKSRAGIKSMGRTGNCTNVTMVALAFRFSLFTSLCLIAALLTIEPASAQTLVTQKQDSYENAQKKASVKRIQAQELNSVGYQLFDNYLIAPELSVEGGYDSNFDEYIDPQGSGYGLVDGAVLFGFIKEDKAVTLQLKSAYSNYGSLNPEDRWYGSATLSTYYLLNQNLEYSSSTFYFRDEETFTNSETYSSASRLDFNSETIFAYLATLSYKQRYINDRQDLSSVALADRLFFRNRSFNIERQQVEGGGLIMRDQPVGIYGKAGVGVSNYTDQPDETRLNRDADEFWLAAGFQFNLSPYLVAELGWRFNRRNLDDLAFRNYDSDGFDAKVTWAPNELFKVIYEADSFIDEPSATFSYLADVRRHQLTISMRPSIRSQLDLYAAHEHRREIGSNLVYEEEKLGLDFAYYHTSNRQFYVTALYEETTEGCFCTDYNRFKLGVGYKINFVRTPGELEEERLLLPEILPSARLIETRIGYSKLYLPETEMITFTNAAHNQALSRGEDHDGEVDGARVDVSAPGFAAIDLTSNNPIWGIGGRNLSFNIAGFYGRLSDDQTTICNSTDIVGNCAYFSIFDSNTANPNVTTSGSNFITNTDREVDHWGVSLEAQVNRSSDPADRENSLFRLGLAVRAIQQETSLFALDQIDAEQIDYSENLDTFYYGAYIALDRTLDLGNRFSLKLNAEAGAYYADTSYKSHFNAFYGCGCATAIDTSVEKLSDQDFSFIGALRVELNKHVAWGTLGLFAEGEYYSYAPKVLFNNVDLSGGSTIAGFQDGTVLGDDEAFSFTLGGRVSVPLN